MEVAIIRTDGGTQHRAALDENAISEYAQAMTDDQWDWRRGALKVCYDGQAYWLVGGFHRIEAAKRAGVGIITCIVTPGTRRDAVLASLQENNDHGVRLDAVGRRNKVLTLLQDKEWAQWSNYEIAQRCGVSEITVRRVRASLTTTPVVVTDRTYVTKHGTIATMQTASIGRATTPITSAAAILPEQSEPDPRTAHARDDGTVITDDGVILRYNPQADRAWCNRCGEWRHWIQVGSADIWQCKACQWRCRDDEMKLWEPEPVLPALRSNGNTHRAGMQYIDPTTGDIHTSEQEAPPTGSDEWYTPAEYIELARRLMGTIDVDPASNEIAQRTVKAATYYTKTTNGLIRDWPGKVWLNPPYSRGLVQRFTARLIAQYEARITTEAVLLVNNATDTEWFHELLVRYPVCFTRGRIAFLLADGVACDSNRQGQAFFYLGRQATAFADLFGAIVGPVLGRVS